MKILVLNGSPKREKSDTMQIVKHIIIRRFSKTKVMVALSVTENHKSRYVKGISTL